MPYKSDAQRRYFNSPEGRAKVGAAVVDEYNSASKGMKLPPRVKPTGGILGGLKKRKRKFK